MLKSVMSGFTALVLVTLATTACGQSKNTAQSKAPQAASTIDYSKITPLELVNKVPLGQLKDPYNIKQTDIVKEGHHLFLNHSCNGCHGGGGGGGMCPPLINSVWVYGGDDDQLFRLITLGSDNLQKLGYMRVGAESVVGPMPELGPTFKNAAEVWKVITWIRSAYDGDPKYRYGDPPDENPNSKLWKKK